MKWAVLVAVLMVVLLPSTALANRWPNEQVIRAIELADGYWPMSSCQHQQTIHWVRSDEFMARFPLLTSPRIVDTAASSTCESWVVWDRIGPDMASLCSVLMQTFGRTAGLMSSTDPNNVMADRLKVQPECLLAFPTDDIRIYAAWHWHQRHSGSTR